MSLIRIHTARLICLLAFAAALTACSSPGFAAQEASQNLPEMMNTPTAAATATIPATATTAATVTAAAPAAFDGERAYRDVERQVAMGPRLPGSEAHSAFVDWAAAELESSGWTVEVQEATSSGQAVRNIIAKRGEGKRPWVIFGAHYDSRMQANADPDPQKQDDPVPGANDGASGVAVLTEMARVLPEDLDKQVWLVLFDAEDQGSLPGWNWILGSRAFADSLTDTPDAVVVVDMIGDADLNIRQERNSNQQINAEIWQAAAEAGHGDVFLPGPGYGILDDHTPFLEKGIAAVDLIDFDYPYWHTTADTADKVSAESLAAVGETLLLWLTK